MSKLLWLVPLLLLGACDNEYEKADQRRDWINQEIKEHGFVKMGKTPSGAPLLMTKVNTGFDQDRVYFAGNTITAVEDCGKNCQVSIVSSPK